MSRMLPCWGFAGSGARFCPAPPLRAWRGALSFALLVSQSYAAGARFRLRSVRLALVPLLTLD
jgi:hypothetical protein